MTTPTVTAYLEDGRHVEVPESVARDWAREAAELTTTDSLADWYLQDDENTEQILGTADDDPRCDHDRTDGDVVVTNASQANGYDKTKPMASARVCLKRACILDAFAWVERSTGEPAVWIGDDARSHLNPPPPQLSTEPSSQSVFVIEGEEFSARWAEATDAQIDLITDFAESVLGLPDTMA